MKKILKLISKNFARKTAKPKKPSLKPEITSSLYNEYLEIEKKNKEENTQNPENSSNPENSVNLTNPETFETPETTSLEKKQTSITRKNLQFFDKYSKNSHTKRIITRLDRNSRWGLAGQILKKKNQKFPTDRLPNKSELKTFLNQELLKDILYIDMTKTNRKNIKHSFIASGYSNRHIYKVAKNLVKLLKDINFDFKNEPRIFGRKDDEWVMVAVGTDLELHLMTESQRKMVALEDKWFDDYWSDRMEKFLREYDDNVKKFQNPFSFKNPNKKDKKDRGRSK